MNSGEMEAGWPESRSDQKVFARSASRTQAIAQLGALEKESPRRGHVTGVSRNMDSREAIPSVAHLLLLILKCALTGRMFHVEHLGRCVYQNTQTFSRRAYKLKRCEAGATSAFAMPREKELWCYDFFFLN